MSAHSNKRPAPDKLLVDIARYAAKKSVGGRVAHQTARYCLMDALSCAFDALDAPACVSLLGPVVPGAVMKNGARVPGTRLQLDPVDAAFNMGVMIRWLDFNDTWWAGGHPSDNFSGVLAVADYLSRTRVAAGGKPLLMRDVLTAAIKAYEIQGVLAMGNNLDDIGLDHVALIKIASAAVAAQLLGGSQAQIIAALSNAFVDGQALITYRKQPNAGPRKSWGAGDATSRGVRLALLAMRGEIGYPSVLTTKRWGFNDIVYGGKSLQVPRAYGSYVIENIRFKIAFPAQRHAQTAAECAVRLHPQVKDRLAEVDKVVINTHQLAIKKITATGPLTTIAARDHSLQYIVAIGLIFGGITGSSYEDEFAADPRIDQLRAKIKVQEDKRYTRGFSGDERSDANAVQVFFKGGDKTEKVEVEYLLGDPKRRKEGLPMLDLKLKSSLARKFSKRRSAAIFDLLSDQGTLECTAVPDFMDLFTAESAKGPLDA